MPEIGRPEILRRRVKIIAADIPKIKCCEFRQSRFHRIPERKIRSLRQQELPRVGIMIPKDRRIRIILPCRLRGIKYAKKDREEKWKNINQNPHPQALSVSIHLEIHLSTSIPSLYWYHQRHQCESVLSAFFTPHPFPSADTPPLPHISSPTAHSECRRQSIGCRNRSRHNR